MKKYILRMIALLVFASVALSSCSVEYRNAHRGHRDGDHSHDQGHDQHYRNY
ncbi:MAG TPA: hypothetical protein VIM16_00420 [Mucilaginibacter sp.]|jgi:hypothetical protein